MTSGAPALADALRVAADAWQRFRAGESLDRALDAALVAQPTLNHPRVPAAAKDIAYTATRHLALIDALVARLAPRAPAEPVAALVAVALGQLLADRRTDHAVVDQAVRAAKAQARTRAASGFVNAVLRGALRQRASLIEDLSTRPSVRLNAPPWWIERIEAAYPEQAGAIFAAQREPPPLVLRINARRATVDDYLARLHAEGIGATRVGASAVWLPMPRPVELIPGFAGGEVSVQDAGAQLAAQWLGVRDGLRVLDACAAPGGKTMHLAELARIDIDAVEVDAQRAQRIEANLVRTGAREHARVRVLVADAAQPTTYATQSYDRILLDAPCTASGVVRRHPDIPWLRRPADVAQLATRQERLLDALWPLLAPAGRLLYVVCSVFPEEGAHQAERFLARRADARVIPLAAGLPASLQLLPRGPAAMLAWDGDPLPTVHDGFFYALFEKI